ncbi:helix-turn-helix transcriptional regulator [Kangiella sediminilitoris]|uniref:XRE family transcriptional regulator n=1 Tax=Kangiella sediminilitoris TaxID=1144748 RepID=A0A1B3B876_9GAMM|nr:helix-turn-helix transcriptional regulator [Kangiella sediminilitoris]AOE49009.1 XRE family transcriptional regulator [Kangiella sediminilitoris]
MTRPALLNNNIKTLRFLHGEMTQQQLAERLELTRQTVAAIEKGKYSPSLEVAFRISRIFDKPIEEIFQFDQPDMGD